MGKDVDETRFELFRSGQALVFFRGSLHKCAPIAEIFRKLAPHDVDIHIYDESGCFNIKISPQMTAQDIIDENYRQMEAEEAANQSTLEYPINSWLEITFLSSRELPPITREYIVQKILGNWSCLEVLNFSEPSRDPDSYLTKIVIRDENACQLNVYVKPDDRKDYLVLNLDGDIEACADFIVWFRALIPPVYILYLKIGREIRSRKYGEIATNLTKSQVVDLLTQKRSFEDFAEKDDYLLYYRGLIPSSPLSAKAWLGARAVLTVNRPKRLPKIHYEWVNEKVKARWPDSKIRYLQEPKEFGEPVLETETRQNHEEELLKIVIDELDLTVYQSLHPNLVYQLYLHGSAPSCLEFILWMRHLLSPEYKVKISINAFMPPSSGREYRTLEITADSEPETILEFISPDPDMTGRALLPY